MVDCPELRDSVKYKLKRLNPPGNGQLEFILKKLYLPVGGVAISTYTDTLHKGQFAKDRIIEREGSIRAFSTALAVWHENPLVRNQFIVLPSQSTYFISRVFPVAPAQLPKFPAEVGPSRNNLYSTKKVIEVVSGKRGIGHWQKYRRRCVFSRVTHIFIHRCDLQSILHFHLPCRDPSRSDGGCV